MKKTTMLALAVLCLVGCTSTEFLKDYEQNVPQPMTFEVREVSLDDVIAGNQEMQVRQQLVEDRVSEELSASDQVQEDQAAGREDYSVNTDILNVRSQPSASSDKVGELGLGQSVRVVDEVRDEDGNVWFAIEMEEGQGYVLSEYLTTGPVDEPRATYRSVINQINVRSGPSEEAEILGELGYFEEFLVYGTEEDQYGNVWLETLYNGMPAYIISDYCVKVE